jgi:hypothetical protein
MLKKLIVLLFVIGIISMASGPAWGGIILENFSSGTLDGWTTTGAWFVSGATNSSPNIVPPNGLAYQALSGVPNTSSEANVGSLTSPAYTVSFTTLSFAAAGWSGSSYTGESYYQILNQNQQVLTTIDTAQSDGWITDTVDFSSIGLSPGDQFYIRAVDGRNEYMPGGGSYSWMGLDLVQETGAAVPEPGSITLTLLGLGAMLAARSNRRRQEPEQPLPLPEAHL